MISPLDTAKLYFDLSNNSDFEGISKLFTDRTIYKSQTSGSYRGVDDILAMQKPFHDKYTSLKWTVDAVDEIKPGVVLFNYTFTARQKDGKEVKSSGLEYVTVDKGRITRIEISNKN